MTRTPTPEGTPTQIYIRFGNETDEGIECLIGTDGEDRAPRNTRMAMVAILQGIAVTMAVLQNMNGAMSANKLANAILADAILKEGGAE